MHEFRYQKSALYCEKLRLLDLASRYETPLYVYSYKTLIDHFRKLREAFRSIDALICYSVKANSNLSILKALVNEGAGLDIVSGGELYRATQVGCAAQKIVYASVGKTDREIEEAARLGILFFNVESLAELLNINRISARLNRVSQVAIRINPDVEPKTHKYITTGKLTNKFGIDFQSAYKIFLLRKKFPNLDICGLHIHIGSQITRSQPYVAAIGKMVSFIQSLRMINVNLKYFNIGGGLGIVYDNETPQTAEKFAKKVLPLLRKTGLNIILEPGRFIVGNAGVLVTKVLYIKETKKKKFVIVDAGMNDLIRPALYEAYHQILPLKINSGSKNLEKVDVVGPICESADFFAKDRRLPKFRQGEYLAIMGCGAYGFSMSSNYNSRKMAEEVMVVKDNTFVIRERDTYEDLIRNEKILLSF
ncbi:MAG: diaminopimelate decarboxylase [Candidatus Omnitrophota bacterium]